MRLSLQVLLFALLGASVNGHQTHKCIHSKLSRQINTNGRHATGVQPYNSVVDASGHHRFLQAQTWGPMRITPQYMGNFGTEGGWSGTTGSWVRNTVVQTAVARFSQMLSVRSVQGSLQIHRVCIKFDETYTPAKCAQYESETSVTIPSMTDDSPDVVITDASVIASDEVVRLSASGSKTVVTLPGGSGGWSNSDLVLFVTGLDTSYCDGGTIAYASSWSKDQFDRPVFGQINLCPSALANMRTGDFEAGLGVIMHEMTHVMVMDSSLFPLWRYKDNNATPRTPRDPLYPFLPAQQFNRVFYCDGQPFLSYIPANNTLQWFNERGMYCTYKNATHSGDCVARLVTPAARQAARTFFNCNNLPGLELENWDTSECSVIGSHLEARTAWADMLNPYSTGLDQGFTILILSIFDDSGWYNVNYTTGYGSRVGTTFGYKQGCGLARDSKCITTVNGNPVGGGSPQHYFTNTQNTQKQQCRLDRKGYGVVAIYDYTSSTAIDSQYRYFPGYPARAGGNEQADFCPLMMPDYGITGLNEGLCSNTLSWSSMPSYDQRRGMRYGANSVCLSTTLYNAAYSSTGGGVGCYTFTCNAGGATATVTINNPSGSGVIQGTCAAANQALTFAGYNGNIVCPDIASMCASRAGNLAADISAMGLASIATEQSTVQNVAPYVPVTASRLPSYAPYQKSSGNSGSSGTFLPQAAWIGIIAAVAGVAVIGGIVSCIITQQRRKRRVAEMQQQQQRWANGGGGNGGVTPGGIQMVHAGAPGGPSGAAGGAPMIVQGIPVAMPYPGYPPQGGGYPNQGYPGYPMPQQQQPQQGGYYYPQPGPTLASPPIAGNNATGFTSYPPSAVSMDPMPLPGQPPMAAMPQGGRASIAAAAPVMAPLGLVPGGATRNPPPYNPSAAPRNNGMSV